MDDRRDGQHNRPQANINLQPKDILEKDFKQKMRGYDPAEVDEFLDDVIKDYETFNTQIQQLSQENSRLISRIDELSKQAAAGQNMGNPASANPGGNPASNYDILKRLSNLERRVFGQQRPVDNNQANPNTFNAQANNNASNRANRYQANTSTSRPANYVNPNTGHNPVNNTMPHNPNVTPNTANPAMTPNNNGQANPNIANPRSNNDSHDFGNYNNNSFNQNPDHNRYPDNNSNQFDDNSLNRY
jgi:DivIVA domain-containing protein